MLFTKNWTDIENKKINKYKCIICGYIYDEAVENVKFEDLPDDWKCPLCFNPKSAFEKIEEDVESVEKVDEKTVEEVDSLEAMAKDTPVRLKKAVSKIHAITSGNYNEISAMGTTRPVIGFDDVLILGAQLNPAPLFDHEDVSLKTVIGKHALRPLEIDMPVYISHMSFGALSKEAKIALAKGSCIAKTAQCSGEGGILPEEMEASYKYIFEYVPNKYSVTDENLKKADAIEIKNVGLAPVAPPLPSIVIKSGIAKHTYSKSASICPAAIFIPIGLPSDFSLNSSTKDFKSSLVFISSCM